MTGAHLPGTYSPGLGVSEADRLHVWHPFTQAATAPEPLEVVRGAGTSLFLADGRELLDLISSWWVCLHGHAHPVIAEAIAAQARRLEQVIFADFTHAPAATLAARLTGIGPAGLSRVFFSDDGSTSVEVALKLAWQYWRNRGEGQRKHFLAFAGGYHGDTFGAMAAGAGSGFYGPFQELLFPVTSLPWPETWIGCTDIDEREADVLTVLERWLDAHGSETAALIAEPLVQGAGGMRMCRPAFLAAVVARCRAAGVLIILDEVMTGFGRTGPLFACQGAGVSPDILCLSKGLTGGFLPMAVTVCREEIYDAFLGGGFERAFAHGHSFTANLLGCAAALASLDLLLDATCTAQRQTLEACHRDWVASLPPGAGLERPRIAGTILAVDVVGGGSGYHAAAGPVLKRHFLERGLLLRPLGNVLYLLPPYCTTPEHLERAYRALEEAPRALR